jgi:hypothetical protein
MSYAEHPERLRIKASYHHPVLLYERMLCANAFGTEGHFHHDVNNQLARLYHHTALVHCKQDRETAIVDKHHQPNFSSTRKYAPI